MSAVRSLCRQIWSAHRRAPVILSGLLALCLGLYIYLVVGLQFGFVDRTAEQNWGSLSRSMFGSLLVYVFLLVGSLLHDVLQTASPRIFRNSIELLLGASVFGLSITLYLLSVALVFVTAQAERTAAVSLWYLELDSALGVYPVVSRTVAGLGDWPLLYSLTEFFYTHTITAVFLAIWMLAVFSVQLSYRYMVALCVAIFISVPFWLVWPAIAPLQLVTTDTLTETSSYNSIEAVSSGVQRVYDTHQATPWADQTMMWVELWEEVPQEGYGFAISSNPSMHIAWGFILVWFVWRAAWWLGVLLIPGFLFQAAGTMVFLQHYVVDIPAGFLVGVLAIWLTARYVPAVRPDAGRYWFAPLYWLESLGKHVV